MITRVDERMSSERVLSLMHPVVSEWFKGKFGEVTEAQALAVPVIHARRNVLVSSPTGSGKTLTAFLSILNELILSAEKGELEDRIYAVYVSPLKALANDINENLLKPLREISSLFESKGLAPPGIKVAVRTGDTLPSERQKQARSPPHIFITTPESLSLVLSTPVFRQKFAGVDYVIVDEVHEICDSKRGVALSLSLERLQSFCPRELVRIGLSATVAPIDQVAEFLGGLRDGTPRDVSIVEVYGQRDLDLKVICPANDMTSLSFEVVNSKMYDLLKTMIDGHRTTLVFTNTRSGTESVVYKLKERGLENVGAHHGSLSRETRLDVEQGLRAGDLKSVVSSTSLELGIDIGSIDLVVQIGSPKSVAKGLQRVGRAGHQYGGTSKGRIVVFESDDLVECAVLCRAAHRKIIDRVTIPVNSLDVLAQVIVGLSIERPWGVAEAYDLVRRSYCYKDLTIEQFRSVLRYLGGKDDFEGVYSKIWYDDGPGMFGKKRGSRMIYYLNQGTIPEEADYQVYSERGSPVGSLSEKFVERLSAGDIFVLGGRSYEFIKTKGTKAFVKSASGRKPTVPSWTGEMMPRSFDFSVLVGRFRGEMDEKLGRVPDSEIRDWLMEEFDVDDGSATTITNYFREQKMFAGIPTDTRLVIEGYIDQSGRRSAIFHYPFGRRVNDALSRAYAHALSQKLGCNVTVSVTDDNFMLTAPRNFELEALGGLVDSGSLESTLRKAVRDSELFSQRFRHVATRSFMVLRNYKGKELSVSRQQLRSQRLLDALHELEDFPVMAEAYVEILTEVMDLEHAREVLSGIESGDRRVEHIPFTGVPSPFAHNVILVGVSDIVLMEDRSMLLRELHRKVLSRVLEDEAVTGFQFDADQVAEYFDKKFPRISSKQDIVKALRAVGPMNLFREKGESVFSRSKASFERLRAWSSELLRDGKVRSVWIGEDVYVTVEDWPAYACLHHRMHEFSDGEARVLGVLGMRGMTAAEVAEEMHLERDDARNLLRKLETSGDISRVELKGDAYLYGRNEHSAPPRAECLREAVVRHLAYHAPITVEDLAYEVGVAEPEAEATLHALLASEEVVSGMFIIGEQQQYMLAKDYLRLRSKGERVYDRETVRAFSERKQFTKASSIDDFFERFGQAGMIYDIFQRVSGFRMSDFGELRNSGQIVLGRFVRGRLRYLPVADVPNYLGVYRREDPNKYESVILRTVRTLGSGTYQEIAGAAGLPPDIMRENFDSLDRKGYLVRLYDEAESWSSRNVYSACEIEPNHDDPFTPVIVKYLRFLGPVTAIQAAVYLDMDPDDARKLLLRAGATSITVGLERTQMFLLPDEVEGLGSAGPAGDRVHILSLYDPFLSDKWTEITSRYGEGWIFPIVHRGKIVGMIEKWLMAGSVEVREILLDDRELLGQLVDAIDDMMEFYNGLNVDIVRVRSVFGTDVGGMDSDLKQEFIGRGYAESNGMLVKGRLVTECFSLEEMLETVFSLQNLGPDDKVSDMSEALARYGGLHSDIEAMHRVDRFESIRRLHGRGEVMRGHLVPDRMGYCTPRDAGLCMSARQHALSENEKLVLKIIRDQQPLKRSRLLDLSPLGHSDTVDGLRSLFRASHCCLDSNISFVVTPRSKLSRKNAWLRIFKRFFETCGCSTAESLALYFGHELSMREVRRSLRTLEDEGSLVKGYMLRGSSTLYWASVTAYKMLGKARFGETFVLPPEDHLTMYLRASFRNVLPETGRFVIFTGPKVIGSFIGKVSKGKLEVRELVGEPGCDEIVARFAHTVGLALVDRGEGRISEWEIMEFYRKSHPGL